MTAKRKPKLKPIWRWVIGVFLFVIVSLAVASWYLSNHWKPILAQKLQEVVSSSTDSLYHVHYDDLSLNLMTGNVSLTDFSLYPDSQKLKQLKDKEIAPDMLYQVEMAKLDVRGFNIGKYLISKKIDLDDIRIEKPRVVITNEKQVVNDTLRTDSAERTVYELISNSLHSIQVNRIRLTAANLTYRNIVDSITHTTGFEELNFTVRDVLIDSVSHEDTTRMFYSKSFELDLPDFRYHTPDSLYYVGFDSLILNTAGTKLTVIGLKYAPRMNKQTYFQRRGVAKDMIILAFDRVELSELDYKALLNDQQIHAASMLIDSGVVEVSNDFRYRRLKHSKIGKSPHQQLMSLSNEIQIDSLFVRGIDIRYAEMSGKYEREGVITFDRAHGWIANVTNDTTLLQQNGKMTADLTAYLMNRGRLNVLFGFDMLDKNGAYTYKGTLSAMDARPINRILTPLLNLEVTTATVKGINFDMAGTDYRNWGTFRMEYDNLKINILQENDEGDRTSKTVVSFLANQLLVHSSNPDAKGVMHVGHIQYQRVPEFSFFKTLWKSLFEGIKQSGGISPERESRMMNIADFFKNPFQRNDNDR